MAVNKLTMNNCTIIFFGSTEDSVIVLEAIAKLSKLSKPTRLSLVAIVTQPSRPVGRKQVLTPTPVEEWAKKHNTPVLSFPHPAEKPWLFENEQTVIDALEPFQADLIISACFGQKIPAKVITGAQFGGLNVHPSLLPRWRGGDPVPWAILAGDHQTGVTVVTLEERFDQGEIIAQKKYPITDKSTSDTLRTELFSIGATLLTDILPDYLSKKTKIQTPSTILHSPFSILNSSFYARRFTRDDGFIPWELIKMAMRGEQISLFTIQQFNHITIVDSLLKQTPEENKPIIIAPCIERALRALNPWPGLWTEITFDSQSFQVKKEEKKRLKILSCHISFNHTTIKPSDHPLLIIDSVQLEGKLPISYAQFQTAYL